MLLSGGLDSALALALTAGDTVEALTVTYGQTHHREVEAAAAIAEHYDVAHTVVAVDPRLFDSALTGRRPIPEGPAAEPDATYVPGRNTVLLALAASRAESRAAGRVVIGVNRDDADGYPDCRPAYLEAIGRVLALGTVNAVTIAAPCLELTKRQVVARARALEVPIGLTWSCYRGGPTPCGRCGACHLRIEAGA